MGRLHIVPRLLYLSKRPIEAGALSATTNLLPVSGSGSPIFSGHIAGHFCRIQRRSEVYSPCVSRPYRDTPRQRVRPIPRWRFSFSTPLRRFLLLRAVAECRGGGRWRPLWWARAVRKQGYSGRRLEFRRFLRRLPSRAVFTLAPPVSASQWQQLTAVNKNQHRFGHGARASPLRQLTQYPLTLFVLAPHSAHHRLGNPCLSRCHLLNACSIARASSACSCVGIESIRLALWSRLCTCSPSAST